MKNYVLYFDKYDIKLKIGWLKFWSPMFNRFVIEDFESKKTITIEEDKVVENVYRMGDYFFTEELIEKIKNCPKGLVIGLNSL